MMRRKDNTRLFQLRSRRLISMRVGLAMAWQPHQLSYHVAAVCPPRLVQRRDSAIESRLSTRDVIEHRRRDRNSVSKAESESELTELNGTTRKESRSGREHALLFSFPFRRKQKAKDDPVGGERMESENEPVSDAAAAVEYVRHGTREFFVERNGDSAHLVRGGRRFKEGDIMQVVERNESRSWHGKLADRLKRWVFPAGYPQSVGPGYTEYTRWRLSAFFFGGMIGVFSTQGLLLAVGVGRQSAAPLAAALQWVIRDGLGRAGRMVFSQVGNGFDAETKQYRLMAALVLNMSCALESLTPAVPSLFLPLACFANMAKGASTVAAASTRSAIYRSFMRAENLGEITAKQETVGVIGDLLGTAVGIVLSRATAASRNLSVSAFVTVSLAHLYSVYHEIRGMQLGTLNRQRAHMLIKYYLDQGKVPNLRDGNRNERIVNRPWLDSLHAPNIDLGARLHDCAPDAEALQYLLKLYRNERYLFTYENTRMKIVLRNDAKSHDCLKAFLQADYFWNRYLQNGERTSRNRFLVEESYRFANKNFEAFVRDANQNGWVTDAVLLRPIGRRVSWNNSISRSD